VQCEELAKKLIANESPYSADIERRQEQLRWAACVIMSAITVNMFFIPHWYFMLHTEISVTEMYMSMYNLGASSSY
jgi:hypothetical protein